MKKESVYELVVWKAKEATDNQRALIVEQTNKGLAQLKGFVKRKVYQSVQDPLKFLDLVEWDHLENALEAVKNMMTIPELTDFMGLIEKTEIFEHYSIVDYHELSKGHSDVVELVAYQLHPEGNIEEFKQAYSIGISQTQGYRNRYILQNSKGEDQWAEFVYWQSLNDAKRASDAMTTNPDIRRVLKTVKEIQLVPQYFKAFK